jgi:aminoglycoside phosphotransferase
MLNQEHRQSFENRLRIGIVSVEESHGKSGSQTYVINDSLILKIYNNNKRSYKTLFYLLEKNKIPCQTFVDEWSSMDVKYLVLKKARGLPISKLLNRNKYYPQLGRVLRQIHQVSLDGYGPIFSQKGYFPTWKDFLGEFEKYESRHSNIVPSLVSSKHYDLIKRLLKHIGQIPFGSGLVHGDFTENNIIVDNNIVVAVIDWDAAIVGDPIMDFAVLDIVGPNVINKELLVKCYLDKSMKKQEYSEHRKDFYFIFSAFITLCNLYETNRDDINLLPQKIKVVCEKYL